MLTKLRSRAQADGGFTLIELLVVILIIGILAAIALPAFLGQRQKAQDTDAKTTVRNAATAAETYFTDQQNYGGMTLAELQKIEPTLPAGLTVSVAGTAGKEEGYRLETTSATGSKFAIIKAAATSLTSRKCTGATAGCKGGTATADSGTW
jgi:type IV pilus assembly protein PilA